MKPLTKEKFNALRESIAEVNGVDNVAEKFTVIPDVEQSIVDNMTESSSFLEQINIIPVGSQQGQRLGLGVGGPIAGRTNTDDEDRKTSDVGDLTGDQYFCKQTNFDTHQKYKTLDAWARFPDFEERYRGAVLHRKSLDSIMIGWNGVEAAEKTNKVEYPLLQDLNIGWPEKVRRSAPVRMMGYDSDGAANNDVFKVGEGSPNYATLDALAFDMSSSLLDSWHVGSDDLVLILGRELWVNHGLTLYNENRPASEKNALQVWFANETVGGLKTVTVPFFNSRGMVITSYDNLSIYFEADAVRRAIIDNPKRDRVEEYLSTNDAYVVEDYGKFAGIRGNAIQLKNAAGEWE